jgi:hypothetical protein
MTIEQQIAELLLEAASLGIREEVLDASEKYIDQGMDQLDALEAAYAELTDDDYNVSEYDIADWDAIELGHQTWADYDDEAGTYLEGESDDDDY